MGMYPLWCSKHGHPYHTLTVATAVGGDLFLSRDAQFLALHEIFTIINWICVLAYCTCIVVGDNQRTGHMGVQATSQPWACGRHFCNSHFDPYLTERIIFHARCDFQDSRTGYSCNFLYILIYNRSHAKLESNEFGGLKCFGPSQRREAQCIVTVLFK